MQTTPLYNVQECPPVTVAAALTVSTNKLNARVSVFNGVAGFERVATKALRSASVVPLIDESHWSALRTRLKLAF